MITKQKAVYDSENFRYVVSPLTNDATISVQQVLRVIKNTTLISWKQLTEFAGLRSQSDCFKICYTSNKRQSLLEKLSEYLTIDVDNNRAYFYDKDHKPASALPVHVSPVIKNLEPTPQTVYTLVPAKVLTRLTIQDPLDRILVMTLTPTNGYLLGIKDITISKPGMSYVVTGSKKTLNELLDHIHFVGTVAGSGSVVISVDDREEDIASVSSTTVSFTIAASTVPSVPSIVLPEDQTVTLNKLSAFDAIEVVDTDKKVMEFNITPFGCVVEGFKSYLYSLHQGEVRTIYGRPKTINEEIAKLKVTALQENAQLGVVLKCGKTTLRQYLKFTVEEESANQQQQEPQQPANPSTPQQPVVTPTVSEITAEFDKESYSGAVGTNEALSIILIGDGDSNLSMDITVDGGVLSNGDHSIAIDGSSSATKITVSGTVDELQAKLETMTLVYAKSGSIKLEFNDTTVVVPITVTD